MANYPQGILEMAAATGLMLGPAIGGGLYEASSIFYLDLVATEG